MPHSTFDLLMLSSCGQDYFQLKLRGVSYAAKQPYVAECFLSTVNLSEDFPF